MKQINNNVPSSYTQRLFPCIVSGKQANNNLVTPPFTGDLVDYIQCSFSEEFLKDDFDG